MSLRDLIESRFGTRCYLEIICHRGESDSASYEAVVYRQGKFYDAETDELLGGELIDYCEVIDYEYHLEPRLQYLEVWFNNEEEEEE